jgi:hypothetical protein
MGDKVAANKRYRENSKIELMLKLIQTRRCPFHQFDANRRRF